MSAAKSDVKTKKPSTRTSLALNRELTGKIDMAYVRPATAIEDTDLEYPGVGFAPKRLDSAEALGERHSHMQLFTDSDLHGIRGDEQIIRPMS